MVLIAAKNIIHLFPLPCIFHTQRCFHQYDINNVLKSSPPLPSKYADWKPVIGLEIHAQLNSASKLFSSAPNKFSSPPNSLVSSFDASAPGTLPVLNKQCVKNALTAAIALNCKINKKSHFDRKHYFYADMPQGYQITQQRCPIAVNGYLDFTTLDGTQVKRVNIEQIQLEQDSGKSLHLERHFTFIDLNRAGVGLMEIVTSPDLTSVDDTMAFVKEIYYLLKHINTCDGKLSEGQFRVDANISLRKEGEPLGTRAEVKNMGSFKSIQQAVEYEIERQAEILYEGGRVSQETRAFDAEKEITVSMREKEGKQDYRFMPEPNLPPLYLYDDITAVSSTDVINIDDLRRSMPQLPDSLRQVLMDQHSLSYHQASFLVKRSLDKYFIDVITKAPQLSPFYVFEWIRIRMVTSADEDESTSVTSVVTASDLAELLVLEHNLEINETVAVEAFERALTEGRSPATIVEEHDMKMISDVDVINKLCSEVIDSMLERNEKLLKKYEIGNPKNKHNIKIFTNVIKFVRQRTNDKVHTKVAKRCALQLLDNKKKIFS